MTAHRRSSVIEPSAVLAALDQGPRTFDELRGRLGIPSVPLRRTIRALHQTGQLFVRGDLIARASYYVREADGFGLGIIHCGGRGAERRPSHLPSDDTGDAA